MHTFPGTVSELLGESFREEKKNKKRKKALKVHKLSFGDEEEEDGGGESSANGTPKPDEDGNGMRLHILLHSHFIHRFADNAKRQKLGKNPTVDTSFLPDREREETERRERETLRQEWLQKQEEIKNEDIEVTYSYWDGTGHRRSVMVGVLIYAARKF